MEAGIRFPKTLQESIKLLADRVVSLQSETRSNEKRDAEVFIDAHKGFVRLSPEYVHARVGHATPRDAFITTE